MPRAARRGNRSPTAKPAWPAGAIDPRRQKPAWLAGGTGRNALQPAAARTALRMTGRDGLGGAARRDGGGGRAADGPVRDRLFLCGLRPGCSRRRRGILDAGLAGRAARLTALLGGVLVAGSAVRILPLPRLARLSPQPGRVHPLNGLRHLAWLAVRRLSTSKCLDALLGDRVFIVPCLRAVGHGLDPVVQTGSTFGLAQEHGIPGLCRLGTGTRISDGLRMENADHSAGAVRVATVEIGEHGFIGSDVPFPKGARVGRTCLLATRVMLPLDGPVQHDCGLLGAPPLRSPRPAPDDRQLDRYRDPAILRQRLAMKTRANPPSILIPRAARLAVAFVLIALVSASVVVHARVGVPALGGMVLPGFVMRTGCGALVLRALGLRVGRRRPFDDGAMIVERTMTEIGDDCTFGERSVLQGRSPEDAAVTSDRIRIGERCKIAASAWVHAGTEVEADARVEADSCLTKGSVAQRGSVWRGNPARPVGTAAAPPGDGAGIRQDTDRHAVATAGPATGALRGRP